MFIQRSLIIWKFIFFIDENLWCVERKMVFFFASKIAFFSQFWFDIQHELLFIASFDRLIFMKSEEWISVSIMHEYYSTSGWSGNQFCMVCAGLCLMRFAYDFQCSDQLLQQIFRKASQIQLNRECPVDMHRSNRENHLNKDTNNNNNNKLNNSLQNQG